MLSLVAIHPEAIQTKLLIIIRVSELVYKQLLGAAVAGQVDKEPPVMDKEDVRLNQ